MGSPAYRCERCGNAEPRWRLERVGDAVVTWSCGRDLSRVATGLQRLGEHTRLMVMLHRGVDAHGL